MADPVQVHLWKSGRFSDRFVDICRYHGCYYKGNNNNREYIKKTQWIKNIHIRDYLVGYRKKRKTKKKMKKMRKCVGGGEEFEEVDTRHSRSSTTRPLLQECGDGDEGGGRRRSINTGMSRLGEELYLNVGTLTCCLAMVLWRRGYVLVVCWYQVWLCGVVS